jgi:hypothetical protein
MFQYLYVAVVYVRYLLCCILVMFDVMTHLMICDIGLLYMYKVITCLCVCCSFCMPVMEALLRGGGQKRQCFFKKILCSSVIFLN